MGHADRFSRRDLMKATLAGSIAAPLAGLSNRWGPVSAAESSVARARALPNEGTIGATPRVSHMNQDKSTQAADIIALASDIMAKDDLKAVILRVTIDGEELVTAAMGESMTGVPATPDMHFRNGAVAISYVANLVLQLVDQQVITLDDKLSTWLPDLSDSDQVTLRMLLNMTSGYNDYVQNAQFNADVYAHPFRQWTPEELIAVSLSTPRLFAPGDNWYYAHTNYVILGLALEKLTGTPMNALLQQYVLGPLGLNNTGDPGTPAIPEPVLHAFTSERRQALGIDPSVRFYEESTFWNPSWTITRGAIETTNIADMAATAVAVGEGTLLSPESHQAQIAPSLLGFGAPLEGCPTCHTLDQRYNYGLGVVRSGSWVLQNPLFFGFAGVEGYLISKKIAIAVANTYGEQSFDDQGNYKTGNASQPIFTAIANYLAPEDALPSS